MTEKHVQLISQQLNLKADLVRNAIELIEHGATIPFISRYRKELTGSMDEVAIAAIKNLLEKFIEVDKRRETIMHSIEVQEKMTDDLRGKLVSTYNMSELEDIYLPYKPKRRTRAGIAKENGLEPFAAFIMKQQDIDLEVKAREFLNENVKTIEDAFQGATDIIAEWISENQEARNLLRQIFSKKAKIYSKIIKGKEPDGIKYGDYYDYNELLKHCPSHRYLAMRRGEEEGFLKITVEPDEDKAIQSLEEIFVKSQNKSSAQVKKAVSDSYKRLLGSSIENEFKASAKEKADNEAIRVFAENLKQLLLAPPLGQKNVLGIDPGFRTGCKLVCLDAQGNLLHNETIYPHPPQNERGHSAAKINQLVNVYKIEAIAIGNGTASRETEHFIKTVRFEKDVKVFIVNESGASVYSASPLAREEFPEFDVTVRGAVSIGRRLMDPLAELVKIDPKSIGVGQYQHDVDQNKLKTSLDQVVEICVNKVGVNLNTASKQLLTYISGLGPSLAQKIVDFRSENGPFKSRFELMNVPRMGDKAFEQSAGFLRIPVAKYPLDNSAVHPESYYVVEKMASDLEVDIETLLKQPEVREKIDVNKYVSEKIGLPTLQDILKELAKPGLDPRLSIKIFEFDPDIHKIEELKPGMLLPGIVTNITRFGCFVDIGVHQDGLVHISQMANRFVSDPSEVVKLHQQLKVRVIEVDVVRKRIQLSLKDIE